MPINGGYHGLYYQPVRWPGKLQLYHLYSQPPYKTTQRHYRTACGFPHVTSPGTCMAFTVQQSYTASQLDYNLYSQEHSKLQQRVLYETETATSDTEGACFLLVSLKNPFQMPCVNMNIFSMIKCVHIPLAIHQLHS